jgi:hypothetical protein
MLDHVDITVVTSVPVPSENWIRFTSNPRKFFAVPLSEFTLTDYDTGHFLYRISSSASTLRHGLTRD